ncbi:MAG: hypothetical protein HYR68_07305 [Burkholderiales bacterium]|nr:hypothetical protein [Burkholderiales bacterium]
MKKIIHCDGDCFCAVTEMRGKAVLANLVRAALLRLGELGRPFRCVFNVLRRDF